MAPSQKEVLYIDVDDEITGVIEKLQASAGKIVVLVLPKRATVFQSIVNMKLLKRTADSAKKNLVLITSEQSVLPLAGAVGLHVANTPQSKPYIPDAPVKSDTPVSVDEIEIDEPADKGVSRAMAGAPAAAQLAKEDEEAIEIDNDEPDEPRAKKGAKAAAGAAALNKKLKVPDFNKFRTRLMLGIAGLIAVILVFILGSVVLPSATITIKTNSVEVPASVSVTSSPAFDELDVNAKRVPGALKEYKKSDVQKVAATGQKDVGTKASGTVTFSMQTNCTTPVPSIPSGTTVSSSNLNFIMQGGATFQPSGFQGGKCQFTSSAVNVTAEKAGDQYNLSSRSYTVKGYSNVSATGSAMSGGTSKIIKVVSQQDIDGAKQKILDSVNTTASDETSKLLKDEGYYPITDTFTAKDPVVTSNPGVDVEAEDVTVSVNLSYTMAGAKKDDLSKLLEDQISKQIDPNQQKILNNGLDNASIRITNKKPNGETSFDLDVRATAGVEQNEADIKKAVAGKKKNEAESIIRSREGVVDVSVSYSPFWVNKVPSKEGKVKVIFQSQNTNSGNE